MSRNETSSALVGFDINQNQMLDCVFPYFDLITLSYKYIATETNFKIMWTSDNKEQMSITSKCIIF
jgi:hypothetical protein